MAALGARQFPTFSISSSISCTPRGWDVVGNCRVFCRPVRRFDYNVFMDKLPDKFHGRALTAISGVLCVILVALWVLSAFRHDFIQRYWTVNHPRPNPNPASTLIDHAFGGWTLSSEQGSLAFYRTDDLQIYDGRFPGEPMPSPLAVFWHYGSGRGSFIRYLEPGGGFLGFHYYQPSSVEGLSPSPRNEFYNRTKLVVPYWAPVLITAIPVIVAWWRRFRRRRTGAAGLCPICSYDLRAHHAGAKCPECGKVIEKMKQM